jgi:hypothetical protein
MIFARESGDKALHGVQQSYCISGDSYPFFGQEGKRKAIKDRSVGPLIGRITSWLAVA